MAGWYVRRLHVSPSRDGANDLLNASLSDKILQYQYIQKLSDKISVMLLPSGNGTIFDLKSLLGQTAPSPSPSAAP